MADRVTASKGGTINDRIRAEAQKLKELLLEAGVDEGTADARLFAVMPNETNLVGNIADLQRAGGLIATAGGGDFAEGVVVPETTDTITGEVTPPAPATEATTAKK